MTTQQMFSIYHLSSYNLKKSWFDSRRVYLNLKDVCEELETEGCWHFRIDPSKKYIYYADLDHMSCSIEEFRKDVFKDLSDYYGEDLQDDDFKYTKNVGKSGSYHISIPRICGSIEEFKKIAERLTSKYPYKYRNADCSIIDTSIYSEHWFRAPNQLKESRTGTEHIIVKGEIRDFIIEFIPDGSSEIDSNS